MALLSHFSIPLPVAYLAIRECCTLAIARSAAGDPSCILQGGPGESGSARALVREVVYGRILDPSCHSWRRSVTSALAGRCRGGRRGGVRALCRSRALATPRSQWPGCRPGDSLAFCRSLVAGRAPKRGFCPRCLPLSRCGSASGAWVLVAGLAGGAAATGRPAAPGHSDQLRSGGAADQSAAAGRLAGRPLCFAGPPIRAVEMYLVCSKRIQVCAAIAMAVPCFSMKR
jgi:hypothetical protein